MFEKIKRLVIGDARNPLDPAVFHKISLVALLAWVGLGADGLSSSCYGPEEAFLALGEHKHLAVILALLVSATVFIISSSYFQTIKLFPFGGGGYNVAGALLGKTPGLLCGSSLLVDYALTIAISVSSGVDAIFSFMPNDWKPFKLLVALSVVIFLLVLNWRGVRESILFLLPIFALFVITHIIAVVWVFGSAFHKLPSTIGTSIAETASLANQVGIVAFLLILVKAYAIGGGSFTGIEAISNSVGLLREPRVETARRAMRMMAISLSVLAGGLLIAYLVMDIHHSPHKTLNAALFEKMVGSSDAGLVFLIITLLSEGALLFVAAQTGFVGGPRVMAMMARDKWVPTRFAHLSDRLVVADGVTLMGLAALAAIVLTGGSVKILVVLYSLSVFFTFVITQLGMCKYWVTKGSTQPRRWLKFSVSGMGFLLSTILIVTLLIVRFHEGSFVSVVVILSVMTVCLIIRAHYNNAQKLLKRLDELTTQFPVPTDQGEPPTVDAKQPTAVILVSGFNGLGLHSLFTIHRMHPNYYKNFVFVSVGHVDFDHFKGVEEMTRLRNETQKNLEQYIPYVHQLGGHAEAYYRVGTDIAESIDGISDDIMKKYPHAIFYAGQLVFAKQNIWTRMLHSYVAYEIQRRLHYRGVTTVILPIAIHK